LFAGWAVHVLILCLMYAIAMVTCAIDLPYGGRFIDIRGPGITVSLV